MSDWLKEFGKYNAFANQRSTDRNNASLITFRDQAIYPRAVEVGDTATVIVRRKSTGGLETYTLAWTKSGTPLDDGRPGALAQAERMPAPSAQPSAGDDSVNPKPRRSASLRKLTIFACPAPRTCAAST